MDNLEALKLAETMAAQAPEPAAPEPEIDEDIDENAPLQELITLLEQRIGTYGFLSRLYFKEVDKPFLDQMHDALYPVETGDPDMDTGYLYIATYLSNLWSESVHELSIEFSRCFFGDGIDAYSAAYPYESVYTSERRLMMEKARSEVFKIYLDNDIARPRPGRRARTTSPWRWSSSGLSAEDAWKPSRPTMRRKPIGCSPCSTTSCAITWPTGRP